MSEELGLEGGLRLCGEIMDNNNNKAILAGVAQWIEHWPVNQRGRWFDSQSGHMPGLQASSGPQQGAHKRQPHVDVSPSLPLCL